MNHTTLDPDQFRTLYLPSEYGLDWDHVIEHAGVEKCCGDWMDPDANTVLTNSIRAEGIHTPIVVKDGFVTDGHHRAAAALLACLPIPVIAGDEAYEGQLDAARAGLPRGFDE